MKPKTKLIFINLLVGIVLGQMGMTISHKLFHSAFMSSTLIYFSTSFLISVFCTGNAYRYSQQYEKDKETRKKAILWFIFNFLFIFLIQEISLFYY